MTAIEFTEETRRQAERIGSADVVVGVAGAISPEELRLRAERILTDLGSGASSLRFVFAWPGGEAMPAAAQQEQSRVTLFPFAPLPPANGEFWSAVSANQRAVLALADSLSARACIVLGS